MQTFDIVLWSGDGWRGAVEGDRVLATVTAGRIEDVIAEASRRVADGAEPAWAHIDEERCRAIVNFAKPRAWYVRNDIDREYGHRLEVTAYPHIPVPSYDGPIIRHDDEKAAISAAFADLRRLGIGARQSLACCTSCASARSSKGMAVYTTSQSDADAWYEPKRDGYGGRSRDLVNDLHIGFQTDDGNGARDLGIQLKQTLEAHGLTVRWDGNPGRKIAVLCASTREREARGTQRLALA